jgi:SAM-dependent methyltransferase
MTSSPHHSHHDDESPSGLPDLADLLDLDAEVMHAQLAELTAWVADVAAGMPVRQVLDLGAGTGSGTLALLARFPGAEVTAVDSSPRMLERLRAKAAGLGLADRVRTVEADLDEPWPSVGAADLAWMSASLHHMADPGLALQQALAALRPGGLLAVVETDGLPTFLPDDAGLPGDPALPGNPALPGDPALPDDPALPGNPACQGLEARCRAAMAALRAQDLPHLGADWGPRLAQAGFTVEAERLLAVELRPPLPESAGRYARACLQRMRAALDGQLSSQDASALDRLTDEEGPDSVLHRDDLIIRTQRPAWAARRPSGDS